MLSTEKKEKKVADKALLLALKEAIEPLVIAGPDLLEQANLLNRMFVAAVENAPDDETDNYTARQISPVFLALNQTLINLNRIPSIRMLTSPDFF